MNEQRFAAGDVIYEEGEPAEAVYFIQSGQVELSKRSGGEEVLLATLGNGEMLGEMGAIRGEPHSTTVRGRRPGALLSLSRDEFLTAFGAAEDSLALHVLRTLCERLANADRSIVSGYAGEQIAAADDIAAIRLIPGGHAVEMQIGGEGIKVESLPFRVGRHRVGQRSVSCAADELLLSAPNSFQLSPQHFAVEERDGGFAVADLGSHLGTLVNGRRVSRFELRRTAPLHIGSNEIVAGGLDSPFRFVLMLEPA